MRYFYLILTFASICLASCKQEEVKTFSSERGVNFVNYDDWSKTYEDDYKSLKLEHNFLEDYATQGWQVADYTQEVGIQLEGQFSYSPISVKVKVEAVDGYELPTLTLPEECVIEPGEYQTHFTLTCKKPEAYDKVYKAKLVFDYSASGLVAGTKERQSYEITISDATIWSDMYVSNEAEWNSSFSNILGTYGPVKVRFLLVALGTSDESGAVGYSAGKNYSGIRQYYYNQKNGWSGGFKGGWVSWYIDDGLYLYEENYGKAPAEADGTPVTFNF